MTELKPCPFCGHTKSKLISRAEHRPNEDGLKAYEWIPDCGFGGDYEQEVEMYDFRFAFYRRCTKCGARSPLVKTPWHVRTEDEAEQWSRNDKYWGFEPSSEWAEPTRKKANEAWNTRWERTCRIVNDEPVEIPDQDPWYGMLDTGIARYKLSCGHDTLSADCDGPKRCCECGAKVVGE